VLYDDIEKHAGKSIMWKATDEKRLEEIRSVFMGKLEKVL
jgi:hypothetical protein